WCYEIGWNFGFGANHLDKKPTIEGDFYGGWVDTPFRMASSAIASGELSLMNFGGEVLAAGVAADDLPAVLHGDGVGADCSALWTLGCSAAVSHEMSPFR